MKTIINRSFLIASMAILLDGRSLQAATLENPYHAILGSENAPTSNTQFNVSVNANNSGFSGQGNFGSSTVHVNESFDNPIIDYRFFNQASAGVIGAYATGPGDRIGIPTPLTGTGGNNSAGNLWTTTDPDSDPNTPGIDYATAANFTNNTMVQTYNASGTIDISGLGQGTIYLFYGAYRNTPNFAITMSGPDQTDVVLANVGNQDFANNNEMYVTTVTFANAAEYDTISYTFSIGEVNNGRGRIGGIVITSPQPASGFDFPLTITPTTPPATGYDFTWPSQPGKVYDLLTSLDLAAPISDWPIYHDGEMLYEAIPADGETTSLTAVPSADPRRFFAVREYVAPPPPPPPVESELSSVWGSGTTVTLNFTEALDETTATDPQNYDVFNLDVFWVVTSAVLSPDGKTVTLTLDTPLPIATTFSVSLSNLTSSEGAPLAGSTTGQFQTWDNDPDGIKVFILAGQSNMVGFGHTETGNGGVAGAIGSLRHLAVNNESFPEYDYSSLLTNPADPATSAWKTRSDVKAWWRDGGANLGGTVRKGDLGPPFLGTDAARYGPEYAFGQVMGDYYVADDVLVIKAAWGGRSLAVDFRPPSAVAARGGEVGPFYQAIFDNVRDVLANLGTEFPGWSGTGYQIVGFGWHQGWNDRVNQTYNDEYEANMKNLIDDVRVELGQPVLPFVIATTGMSGWDETHPRALSLMNAQLAMKDFTKYPDFEGNVDVTDTRDFWRDATVSPVNQGFHWNQNGETMFLIGKSMGDRMVDLLAPSE